MKKLSLTTAFICAGFITTFAQVGIGTASPNTSSILDLTSTSKALLLPRLTSTQRDSIASPVAGMVIFNTTSNCMELFKTGGWYNVCTGITTAVGGGGIVDGYDSSNDVAKTNLLAHWTFDNTKAEVISGLTPTTNGPTSFTTGLIGGANGALAFNGANLVYPVISSLNNANALAGGFTLSMWLQTPVQPLFTSLWQLNGNIGDIFGLVGLAYRKSGNDTLDFDGDIVNATATSTTTTAFAANKEGAASGFKVLDATWAFITMTYDSTSKTLNYYGNGALKATYNIPTSVIAAGKVFTLLTTTSPAATGNTATSQVTFGALDVNPPLTGSSVAPASWQSPNLTTGTVIDDTRLFNTTLTAKQISDLYQLGTLGR